MMDITIIINDRGEDQAEEEVVLLDKSLKQLTQRQEKAHQKLFNLQTKLTNLQFSRYHLPSTIVASSLYSNIIIICVPIGDR